MNVDSYITNFIINKFVRLQKPILSVHDGYILGTRDAEILRDSMRAASLHIVGTDLAAEQEIPSYRQIMVTRYQNYDAYLHLFRTVFEERSQQKTDSYYRRYHHFQKYKEGGQ